MNSAVLSPGTATLSCSSTEPTPLDGQDGDESIGNGGRMDVIPVPEIVVVLVIALAFLSVRALWGVHPAPLAPRVGDFRRSRQEGTDTEHMRARLVASCVVFVIISIPLILRVVPPNGIYGFRIAATQASRAIWYPASAFMGWALLVGSVVSATLLVILPGTVKRWLLWATFLAPMCGAIMASFVYVSHLS